MLFTILSFPSAGIASPTSTDDWKTASPKALGFNESLLNEGLEKAAALPYSHSLLVVRNGKIAAERYFHGYGVKSANNLKSITKSVTSALIGIALEKRILKSIDEPVRAFFPDLFRELNDPRKDRITLRNLLNMSVGIDANDELPGFDASEQLDQPRYVFTRPLIFDPGAMFSYTSAYTTILSQILTDASKISTRNFAQKHLFSPLGIEIMGWSKNAAGYYLGQSSLFLTTRNMAKFGLLFLSKGRFRGRQVIPEKWVTHSTAPLIKASEGNGHYGYGWWVKAEAPVPFFYAWGYGGQYIYIVPSKNLIIVMTNDFSQRRPQIDIRAILEQNIISAAGTLD